MDSFENSRNLLFDHVEKLATEQPKTNKHSVLFGSMVAGSVLLLGVLLVFFMSGKSEIFSTVVKGDGYVQINNNIK